MKIYRLVVSATQSGKTISWHWSKEEADREHFLAKTGYSLPEINDEYESGDIDLIEFPMTKAGIMKLLRRTPKYDNGLSTLT
jgi:hypothetical protein